MDVIIEEINQAIEASLYYVGIAVALSLPDICGALGDPSGEASGARYKAWYEAHVAYKYPRLTSVDCYSLRCGVLHQGRFGHPRSQYARVLFTIRNPKNIVFHNNVINDALNLDAVTFCRDMTEAVRAWFATAKNDATVQANLPNLVQARPHGLAPYMDGLPVIT